MTRPMHIEFLCEERSMEVTLRRIAEQVLPSNTTYHVRVFAGKPDLLGKLAQRLRGYRPWSANGALGICVLVDEDREDCLVLKRRLEEAAQETGLATKSSPDQEGRFHVLNRVVVEELEAWFFGDPAAVRAAYPAVANDFHRKAAYRDPDAVRGGTWEALERLLQKAGYHSGGLRKTLAAEEIASHLRVERTSSRSFQAFRSGLTALAETISQEDDGDERCRAELI